MLALATVATVLAPATVELASPAALEIKDSMIDESDAIAELTAADTEVTKLGTADGTSDGMPDSAALVGGSGVIAATDETGANGLADG